MLDGKVFFGFALAASMFSGTGRMTFREVSADEAKMLLAGEVSVCLNPSHAATISAMKVRYGIEVEIPVTAPSVSLVAGDSLLVMGVRGLPRLDATRHEYTVEEIDRAHFVWQMFTRV